MSSKDTGGPGERRGNYGDINIKLCPRCTLNSPNLHHFPICSSTKQVWSGFICGSCGVRGLLNVSIDKHTLSIYPWDPGNPIVEIYLKKDRR